MVKPVDDDEKQQQEIADTLGRLGPPGERFVVRRTQGSDKDAWLGVDSLNGRYRFGSEEAPPHGTIEPRQLVLITERVYAIFKGTRLFVHRSCASDFLIRNVYVGAQCGGMAIGSSPLIAEPFAVDYDQLAQIQWSADSTTKIIQIKVDRKAIELLGAPFVLPTMQPGIDLSFEVEHIGHEPRRFLAAFYGKGMW